MSLICEKVREKGVGEWYLFEGGYFFILWFGEAWHLISRMFSAFLSMIWLFSLLHALSRHPLFWHHSPIFTFSIWLTRLMASIWSFHTQSFRTQILVGLWPNLSQFIPKFESVCTQVWVSLYPSLSQFIPKPLIDSYHNHSKYLTHKPVINVNHCIWQVRRAKWLRYKQNPVVYTCDLLSKHNLIIAFRKADANSLLF